MALATRCPHCHTTFRVVHDQLKLRSGMVRCGSCQQVFNGIEHLIRANTPGTVAASSASTPAAATQLSAHLPANLPPPSATPAITAPEPVAPPEMHQPEPLAPVPQALAPVAEPLAKALPSAPAVLAPDANTAVVIVAQPVPPATINPAPVAAPEIPAESSARPAPEIPDLPATIASEKPAPGFMPIEPVTNAEPSPEPVAPSLPPANHPALNTETLSTSTRIEPQLDQSTWPEIKPAPRELAAALAHHQEPQLSDDTTDSDHVAQASDPADDADEPGFVKAGRRQQKLRRVWSILQATCFVLLLTALLGQCLYTWRDIIAVRWPASKIMLFNACTLLHCKVGLPTQIQHLSIELGELQVLPRNKNTFSYTTALRNHSNTLQAWPNIELVLLDNNETPVARRVFVPGDYLQNPADTGKGIGPQAEQPVKLYFEFHQLKAASYRAEIFYP